MHKSRSAEEDGLDGPCVFPQTPNRCKPLLLTIGARCLMRYCCATPTELPSPAWAQMAAHVVCCVLLCSFVALSDSARSACLSVRSVHTVAARCMRCNSIAHSAVSESIGTALHCSLSDCTALPSAERATRKHRTQSSSCRCSWMGASHLAPAREHIRRAK